MARGATIEAEAIVTSMLLLGVIYTCEILSIQIHCTLFVRKISSIGQSRIEKSPKCNKTLQSWEIMAFTCWSWSMMEHTCRKNCYCMFYCNPIAMSWLRSHLCSAWLTCSMSRSDRAKASCDYSLFISLCGCLVILQKKLERVISMFVLLHGNNFFIQNEVYCIL